MIKCVLKVWHFALLAIAGFLAGCSIEVWEGKVVDYDGETLWSKTYFDEEECKRLTDTKANALYRERVKRTNDVNAVMTEDWNCTLTVAYGF